MASPAPISDPLDTARHLKYNQRCLSLLPRPYTSNDSTRLALAFFGLAAVDLLSPASTSSFAHDRRRRLREWVLSCQHAGGGFCGSPTHVLPAAEYEGFDFAARARGEAAWQMGNPGAANIAATSFALKILALLADDTCPQAAFSGVDRLRTLRWLRRLQRDDGSFGEVLEAVADSSAEGGERWMIAGGRDMRYCYLAATIRWMLRGDIREGEEGWVEDIDVDALVAHIRRGQVYDGGIAETAQHEAHAGYAFCAASSLYLLDRPSADHSPESDSQASRLIQEGISDLPALVHFLVSRQFAYIPTEEESEDKDPDNFFEPPSLSGLSLDDGPPALVGYNGRCNKVADTCYCWWVAGSLSVLLPEGAADAGSDPAITLLAGPPSRAFLMTKTQHLVGGFGKHPGDPPDVYHGCLGLAALSLLGEPNLRQLDAAMCMSVESVRVAAGARAELLRRCRSGSGLARHLLDLGVRLSGQRPEWLAAAT